MWLCAGAHSEYRSQSRFSELQVDEEMTDMNSILISALAASIAAGSLISPGTMASGSQPALDAPEVCILMLDDKQRPRGRPAQPLGRCKQAVKPD